MNEDSIKSCKSMSEGLKSKNRRLPPNLTRRAHRKSRNGCFRCKQRRKKCDENQPSCTNCFAKSMICTYPEPVEPVNHQVQDTKSRFTVAEYPLHTPAKPFSWQDMQALHHFLIVCPPSLPLGNRDVWITLIPQIAHQKPFLMQGILAFGSSHLSRLTNSSELAQQALQYKCRAINGIQNHFESIESWSILDVDAAIATSYVLAFQAVHTQDTMYEYLALVSGCGSLVQHIRSLELQSRFRLTAKRVSARYGADIAKLLANKPGPSSIKGAYEAFDSLESYLTDPADIEIFVALQKVLQSFDNGACVGLLASLDMYGVWHHLSGAWLPTFLKPCSTISRLLLMHLLTTQLILWGLLPYRWWPESFELLPPGQPFVELLQWITALDQTIPKSFQGHLQWSRSVVCTFRNEIRLVCNSPTIILDPSAKDLCLRNIHLNAHIVLGDILRVCAELNTWFETLLNMAIKTASNNKNGLDIQDKTSDIMAKGIRLCPEVIAGADLHRTAYTEEDAQQTYKHYDTNAQQECGELDFISSALAESFFGLMPDAPG